jgi:hypothetical protein
LRFGASWLAARYASKSAPERTTFMDKFEEFGKRIDEELQRFRHFLEDEVAPETERRGAIFLREVSEKLGDAAKKLEARNAARAANTQKPQV